MSSDDKEPELAKKEEDLWYKIKAGTFLASATGFGILFGFSGALATAKKQDAKAFDQGLVGKAVNPPKPSQAHLYESGAALATRALGYGTLFAVAGTGIIVFSIWKLSGAKNLEEFRVKAGSILPVVPKNNPPQSRTEFSGIRDFLQYVIDKDKEEKAAKEAAKKN